MPLTVHYVTKQAILEEAGLLNVVLAETLSGTINGTNKVFTTLYKPLSDANYDDEVDPYDVVLYVNGSPVDVASVDATSGALTAIVAPATNAVVTADYRYSAVTDQYVTDIREDVEDTVGASMDAIDPLPYTTVPPTIRKIARVYAAGLLLSREYGFQRDMDGQAKDGMARIRKAEQWLKDYVGIGGSTGLSDVSAAEVDVYTEPDLFTSYNQSSSSYVRPDDRFMRDIGAPD